MSPAPRLRVGDLPPDAQLAIATRPLARLVIIVLGVIIVAMLLVGIALVRLLGTIHGALDPQGCLMARSVAAAQASRVELENDNRALHGAPPLPPPPTLPPRCRR